MMKRFALLAAGIVVVLLISGAPFGFGLAGGVHSSSQAGSTAPSSGSFGAALQPTLASDGSAVALASPPAPTSASASITIANFAKAQNLPPAFWGVNVAAAQPFKSSDATKVAATPVTYIRFPGGVLGEEFNYTSAVLTNDKGGHMSGAATTVQAFITACDSIQCHAILQLPAEIDRPQTAAYYVSYVEKQLHFTPDYWEVGNAVQSWTHFDTPWSQWGTISKTHVSSTIFATELQKYIVAIRAVDPKAQFVALGMQLGNPNNDQSYITEIAKVDGKNLAGISVHSYASGSAPPNPTWADLLANLNGKYSLTTGVESARAYIKTGCPTCTTTVFVSEINAAETSSYSKLLPTFAGTIYVAADTAQAIDLRLSSVDWFAYSSSYLGAWEVGNKFGQQYTLMSQMMNHLGPQTLATNVTGPSLFFGAATYGSSGLSVLLVNAEVTQSISLNLAKSGILSKALVQQEQWKNGTKGPTNSSFTNSGSVTIPALSITILSVAKSGLNPSSVPPAAQLTAATPVAPPGHAGPMGQHPPGELPGPQPSQPTTPLPQPFGLRGPE